MANKQKKHRRHFLVFFIILFIGISGLFVTKTDFGFTLAYRILRNRLLKDHSYTLSIRDLSKSLDTRLQADQLQFSNEDSSLVFSIDTTNIDYRGIYELLGKRRVDSIRLMKPKIYIRTKERKTTLSEIPDLEFPAISIGHIFLKDAELQIRTPDTLICQTVGHAEFSYSGNNNKAQFDIHRMELENESLDLRLYDMSSEVTVNNNIVKLRNLHFRLNEAEINSSGKIRYVEPFRFKFLFSVKSMKPDKYYDHSLIHYSDNISMQLEIMGNFKEFFASAAVSGMLNQKKIGHANINIEYKNDYLHLLEASFKNEDMDISLYGSYGIKDNYISTTFNSYDLNLSAWFPDVPEFALSGRMRASGYMDKRLNINYDFQAEDLYGMDKSSFQGCLFLDEMQDIILDSTNYIYLPEGILKARGKITELQSVDLDVYGDMSNLDQLKIPGIGNVDAENLILTLKFLGELQDPDVQVNLNLDTLTYDRYAMNNLNLSLYSNNILTDPRGALLVSFENAFLDSSLIGDVQTYIRMDEDSVHLDYFDVTHDNYSLSLAGNVKDFTKFTINSMQGRYMEEDVYLLDSVSFSISDEGFSLSRFDILYRDALLYGSLDTKDDSVWGSVNITGAELNSLPLISTMPDSVGGRLEVNLNISGFLDAPDITAEIDARNVHASGLDAQRVFATSHYEKDRFYIDDLRIDIEDGRSIDLFADIPVNINFNTDKIFRFLPQDSLRGEFKGKNVQLKKLAPYIVEDFPISGEAGIQGKIYGTLNEPRADGRILILNPEIDEIKADTLRSDFSYNNKYMYFNNGYFSANNGHYRGNAYSYLDLGFTPEGPRFSADSTVYAYVQGRDDELIYLTPYIPNVESLTGDIHNELEIRGSFNETVKNGRVKISNGKLILSMLANEIINIDGEAVMNDNVIDMDLKGKLPSVSYTLAGVLGLSETEDVKRHNFSVQGDMNMQKLLEPVFDLTIDGNNVSIVTLDEDINITTGNIDLAVTGQDTLMVTGDLGIREGQIEMGFKRPVDMREQQDENKLYSEYSINAIIDKIYFRNQFIDATLQGEMNLLKYADEKNVRFGGELEVSQGFFSYWASVFELEEGSIQFDQFEGDHELNFVASKNISGGNRIIASITGELNNPEINFIDEKNQMSTAEIVRELTIGEIENTISGIGNSGSAARTSTALLALAERPLEQQAQKIGVMGGLDRVNIKGGEGTYIDSTTAVVVGGRIGRNFYLTYEGSPQSPLNIEIEYRINSTLSVVGSADEESVSGAVRLRVQY